MSTERVKDSQSDSDSHSLALSSAPPVERVDGVRATEEAERIGQAVKEGYPDVDEVCPGCGTVFKNYHHFIRCDRRPCPMSTGKTLFEHWAEMYRERETPGSANASSCPAESAERSANKE